MSITRVDYRERQRLTTPDLRAEQDYRLAAAAATTWGRTTGASCAGCT